MGQAHRVAADTSPSFLDDLIGDILHGDMGAWRVFHEHTVRAVTAEAMSLAGNWEDANEIVRGVYEQAFHQLPGYDPNSGSVSVWLRGFARQLAARRGVQRPVNLRTVYRMPDSHSM